MADESSVAARAEADELRPRRDVVSSIPPLALKELLSMGVCAQCICRIFGNCRSAFASSHEGSCANDTSGNICRICCGILQFIHVSGDGTLVRHNCADDLAIWISKVVKQEGHHTDSFSLEVSVPPTILENENSVWLSLKNKYGSEEWLHEKLQTEAVSVKDAFKLLITSHLEKLLGFQLSCSSFRLRLTYSFLEESVNGENKIETNQISKRRKTDFNGGMGIGYGSPAGGEEQGADTYTKEAGSAIERCSRDSQDPGSKSKVPACRLACLFCRSAVYIGGRYMKFSRNVSQTRWIIDDERMGEASVEEIVGNVIFPACKADSYKFHAAGREDIDVRMLGSGRPFLVEIQNARILPSEELTKEMEMKINSLDKNLVKVKNLKVVDNQGWALMREGEAEKQKQYAALVWISRELQDQDLHTISSFQDLKLAQRTPIRVLHRRSPLEREKIIHWMKIEKVEGSSQHFLLHLCAQAGTYIKEFVHGDLGRTYPSIGSILGCGAEILQLDVTDVKMDCF